MKKKFCPKCGKETDELYGGVCLECFLNDMKVDWLPEYLVVDVCKHCGYYYHGKERFKNVQTLLRKRLKNLFKKHKASILSLKVLKSKLRLELTLEKSGIEKRIVKKLPLKFHYITCPYCMMKRSGYHNAVLQVTLPSHVSKEDIISLVEEEVKRLNKRDPMAFVSGIEEKGKSIIFKIGNKSTALKLMREIKRRYGGKVKYSRKIVTKKEGKNLFRLTVSIKIE